MRTGSKIVSILLAAMLLCTPLMGLAEAAGLFTPGSYTGTGEGMGGDVKVTVTFDAGKITDIVVGEHAETAGVSDPAIAKLPQAILDAQSTQVDVVAGATLTSNAIIAAVNDAIVQSGADPAALVPVAQAGSGETTPSEAQADVVVVGGGLAGLSAAIKASQGGASVILIEKMATLGGSSALSGGGLGATNSSVQKENGITDTNEDWRKLWEERQATSPEQGSYPDWEKVDALIAGSADSIDWYRSLGYEFRAPEGFGVDPVKRLHFPSPEGNGSVLTNYLGKKAEELGITVMLETRGTELIEENGVITGIMAEGANGPITLKSKAVVLACGGFGRSEELTARFTPEVSDYIAYTVTGAGNTGDGIVMAEKVGATPYEDPWLIGLGLTSPVREMGSFYWYGMHIFLNMEGKRFTNEAGHYAIVYNDAVYNSPGGSLMVFDSGAAFESYVKVADALVDNKLIYKADTIEELAAAVGISPENAKATIDAYNQNLAAGTDEFSKPAAVSMPITTAPYYAVRYFPMNMGTFGGVKVGEHNDVLGASGEPIPGLYAAGEMLNRPYYAQVYMSGSALQLAATTGQTAGEAAAQFALGK